MREILEQLQAWLSAGSRVVTATGTARDASTSLPGRLA